MKFELSERPASWGHHFLVGLSGPALNRTDKALLRKLRPAGIMLLANNFLKTPDGKALPYAQWLESLRSLLREAQSYAEREQFIVSIDHEGGRVMRAPAPVSLFPYARHQTRRVREVVAVMAVELKALGINLVLGPVADVHSNPANPVIGERSFASSPEIVTESVLAFCDEMAKHKLAVCPKHFPGHGDTAKDSHLELPILDCTVDQLRNRELAPFGALVKSGVPMIMTAHILFPKVDPQYPATLSQRILKGILRDELGFNGVILTDDLDMKAVADRIQQPDSAAALLNSSADIAIVSQHQNPGAEHSLKIVDAMYRALRQRLVNEDILHASFVRTNVFLSKLPQSTVTQLTSQEIYANNQLAQEITSEAQG